jgi:hypothetical protein
MKSSDRTILIVIGIVGLLAAFWFLLLSPKREEASQLEEDVTALQLEVAEAEEAAASGAAAKKGFEANYRKLVSLGKAVPKDADTSNLLLELEVLADRSRVDFRGIELDDTAAAGASAAAAPAAPAAPAPPAEGESEAPAEEGTTTAAVPTEASAALLPIGATVGSAGLPVMPYEMEFQGGFFEIADFFGRIDGLVDAGNKDTAVSGRLMTINGFSFTAGAEGFPSLQANLEVSSYLTPADQGITAGATATGPATTTTAATETAAPAAPAATATPPAP